MKANSSHEANMLLYSVVFFLSDGNEINSLTYSFSILIEIFLILQDSCFDGKILSFSCHLIVFISLFIARENQYSYNKMVDLPFHVVAMYDLIQTMIYCICSAICVLCCILEETKCFMEMQHAFIFCR